MRVDAGDVLQSRMLPSIAVQLYFWKKCELGPLILQLQGSLTNCNTSYAEEDMEAAKEPPDRTPTSSRVRRHMQRPFIHSLPHSSLPGVMH